MHNIFLMNSDLLSKSWSLHNYYLGVKDIKTTNSLHKKSSCIFILQITRYYQNGIKYAIQNLVLDVC